MMSCANVTLYNGIACVSLHGHRHSGRSMKTRPLKSQVSRGSGSSTNNAYGHAGASSDCNKAEEAPLPPPPTSPQSFSVSRRSAIAGTGGMLIAGATAIADSPAEAAAESFCGINGGVVPQWAYRTDFGQFFVEINGLNTYIRTVGSPPSRGPLNLFGASNKKVPVLVLHGGPGLSSSYMESLELLAAEGRQVVFYDQFGCGKSKMKGKGTRDPEASDYTLDSFVAQLGSVRKELGLEGAVHLLAHGWGGMLALEACTRADGCKGVVSLTVVSATPSTKLLVEDRLHAAGRLPGDVSEELLRQDSRGEGGAWTPAMQAYSAEFINRQSRGCYSTSRGDFSKDPMNALQGGHMFSAEGTMANWDVTDRLGSITVPTLVVRGENDEISMASMDELMKGIHTAKGLVCLDSGSCCHLDNPGTFLKEVNDHMDVSDGSGVPEA